MLKAQLDPENKSMRSFLAEATRRAHDALHVHPLMSRLLEIDLTHEEYTACLNVNACAFCAIETARQSCGMWDGFSLGEDVAALHADLGQDPQLAVPGNVSKMGAHETLGALYVAHGSRFGGQVIAKALRKSLPDASHHFFGVRTDSQKWRALVQTLDAEASSSQAQDQIEAGAHWAFALVQNNADAAARGM